MALDLDALLAPVSDDAPSGESIEYDSSFMALQTNIRGVAEERDASGAILREAEEPSWPEISEEAQALAGRSKDLQLAIFIARSEIGLGSLPGFRDSLKLIAGYLDQYWSSVHPQLDPDDDNDPSARVNAVAQLCDIETIQRPLRQLPLTTSRGFPRINYRHYAIATGVMPTPANSDAERLPDAATIDGAFADTPDEVINGNRQALLDAAAAIEAIDEAFNNNAGYGVGPDLTSLAQLIREMRQLHDRQVALKAGEVVPELETPGGGDGQVATGGNTGGGAGPTGAIRNRNDVTLLLDKIIRYYNDNEPSSPVPMILERAKRLSTMNFFEMLQDLAPDGVHQFRVVSGLKEDENSGNGY